MLISDWSSDVCSSDLVDADPINHFSAIFGHHMEEVVDHSRVGTVLTNLQVKSGVHVHRHRFDSSTTLWPQFFEERPDRCSTATFTDPQHSSCIDRKSTRLNSSH